MIKGSIQAEDITIVNIHIPNIGGSQYIKQILMNKKGEIDSNAMIIRDTQLMAMDKSLRENQ